MGVPERLVEVWAAGADGRGECGSGWLVGHSGVVSCCHLLKQYLASADVTEGVTGQARIQIRQAALPSAEAWIDCALVWQHPVRDLGLLQITPRADQSWDPPKGRPVRLAATGERPSECVAMGFPDAEARPMGLRDSEQVAGRLLPAGRARDPDGLIPFDVDVSVPDDAALWAGFSGSAVVDQRSRLLGLVVKAHPERQRRRLLVVPVEDAASDPAFAAAAAVVGLNPAVENFWAPSWRESVEPRALTATGVPLAVADVQDLKVFGVHGSSAGTRGSHLEYVGRDRDVELGDALAGARGGGQRVVLVVGDSAAGKSRSAAEALRRDRVLCSWRLVVPLSDGGLFRLADADLGWQDTVLWLDDLDKYLARLDLGTLRRILSGDPTVMVVATMRTSQLQGRQGQLADPAWRFLTDDTEVRRVDLDASLSEDELQAASAIISDPAMLNALHEGVGLGEWLVAGPELLKKLNDERDPLNRAFADTVIAWYRTGLDQPLACEDARQLWADTLPSGLHQRLLSRGPEEQDELFEQASAWACRPVFNRALYEQALISKVTGGYIADDYVLDQIVRDPYHTAVPDPVWERTLQIADRSPESQRRTLIWAVGMAAYQEHALAHSLTAMQTLAKEGNRYAWFNAGMLQCGLGSLEEEMGFYDRAVARFSHPMEPAITSVLAARAFLAKGLRLGQLGRFEDAAEVYQQMLARFGEAAEPELREPVAQALFDKGATLGQLGRFEDAVGVYDQVVARFGDAAEPELREPVAKALVNKGISLRQLGRSEEEMRVYEQVLARFGDAAEPELREQVAMALVSKGVSLRQLGRSEDAGRVYDQVVARFGDATEAALRQMVAVALVDKGVSLRQLGRSEEEMRVYEQVLARFGDATEPELHQQVAWALLYKGIRLAQLDHLEGAIGVFHQVVARFGDAAEPELREPVAMALVKNGAALGQLGRSEGAVGVYDEVVARFGDAAEPELREQVATALVLKGFRLGQLGRPEEGIGVYDQVVARFGAAAEPELRQQVAQALISKGVRLSQLGRPEEEIGVYDQVLSRFGAATEPELRGPVARALMNKAVRLGQLGHPEVEMEVYDQVVARFGAATEPEVHEQVARALISKGLRLGQLGRPEEEIGVYDQVVARFGAATEPELRDLVVRALMNKAVRLSQLGRPEVEMEVYDQVVARFGAATEPELRDLVARALINKAVRLGQLGRYEDAVRVYDQVLARFGDATEPELRQHVTTVLRMKAKMGRRRLLAESYNLEGEGGFNYEPTGSADQYGYRLITEAYTTSLKHYIYIGRYAFVSIVARPRHLRSAMPET